ncbi:MAG TPA: hypothetical protein VN831_19270, partial [Bradyrhizobium sp.]|nr:hypothetical protein [Bradyrhizobium sp.]
PEPAPLPLSPSALMLRSNVTEPRNDIVEKGLAIRSDWSGTVGSFRAPRALRDPAPPARSPWRGFGGAAAAANRTEDLNVQICQEATSYVWPSACGCGKRGATHR